MSFEQLTYERDGAARFARAVPDNIVADLAQISAAFPSDRAGTRLYGIEALRPHLSDGVIASLARRYLGVNARPVRAILFDKTPNANWALGWHQDRTIAVTAQLEAPGFSPWTKKQGILHVGPPFEILAGMVTMRVHLDEVTDDNAPLLIAPRSHRFGLVPEAQTADVVAQCGVASCHANVGDIWLYATPILHASKAAAIPHRRRVLQIDYAATDLPHGLKWLGI